MKSVAESLEALEEWRKNNPLDYGWELISPSFNLQAWARTFIEHQEVHRCQGKTPRAALNALCVELGI